MYQSGCEDTIVAISTPLGQGGIGIIRMSGNKALAVADKLFLARSGKKPSLAPTYTVHYGWIVSHHKKEKQGSAKTAEIIDEALLTVMRAPKSYTTEDVVEISCHSGLTSLQNILNLCLDLGARLAEPGEFTKRAFLNGRIDLAQAEAVLDVIQSRTDAYLKVSLHQLKGDLTVELEAIREILMNTYVEVEAIVNFPEDEINAASTEQLSKRIQAASRRIKELLKSSEQGRILREGIKIVICGKPNVGKSSLLNVLLKQPRAIVSQIPGTTRDTIEENAQIKGVPFQVIDTAGILEPRDFIEEEAVKRSRQHIESADLILFVLDGNARLGEEDERLIKNIKEKNLLILINKCDLPLKLDEKKIRMFLKGSTVLKISALKKTGIRALEKAIVENVWHGKTVHVHGILVSNMRHINALNACAATLERIKKSLKDGLSFEFISEEVKLAVNYLDNITGRNVDEDLLDSIFSQFCIGK